MEMDKIVFELSVRSDNAKKVIDALYDEPVINCFLDNNIIVETTGYSRNQIFTFKKYTDLFLK